MRFQAEEEKLLEGLVAAVAALPGGDACLEGTEIPLGPRGHIDAMISATVGGQPLRLLIEAKREAFPRDVRQTVWQLRNYIAHLPVGDREVVPFFVANSISPGARDILREEAIGFYDLGGSLYIPASHAFVFIDRPPPRKAKKIFDSVFQGQKARITMAIFERRDQWLSVKELAESTEVSPATASATLVELERREWVRVEGAGPSKLRRLSAPGELLDAWTAYILNQRPPSLTRYYVSGGDARALAQRLDHACDLAGADYAITAEAAAQVYAPYLSSVSQIKCRIEPGGRQQGVLERLNARPVSEGWNLGLIETRSRGDVTVGARLDGAALAPPLQVYLDLLQGSGRSKEMAAHLRADKLEA